MRREVEQYLNNHAVDAKKADAENRAKVLIEAGLYEYPEITEEEYKKIMFYDKAFIKEVDGVRLFYKKEKVPLEVTDEEYAAILATIPKEEERVEDEAASSGAATFFAAIAWIIWIGGLILAIALSVYEAEVRNYWSYTETKFSFSTFITTYITYFVYGCVSMCAAELFKKLQGILNTLKDIKGRLNK